MKRVKVMSTFSNIWPDNAFCTVRGVIADRERHLQVRLSHWSTGEDKWTFRVMTEQIHVRLWWRTTFSESNVGMIVVGTVRMNGGWRGVSDYLKKPDYIFCSFYFIWLRSVFLIFTATSRRELKFHLSTGTVYLRGRIRTLYFRRWVFVFFLFTTQ